MNDMYFKRVAWVISLAPLHRLHQLNIILVHLDDQGTVSLAAALPPWQSQQDSGLFSQAN